MKKFGLISGTSWHSTVEFYTKINRAINERHGDHANRQLESKANLRPPAFRGLEYHSGLVHRVAQEASFSKHPIQSSGIPDSIL